MSCLDADMPCLDADMPCLDADIERKGCFGKTLYYICIIALGFSLLILVLSYIACI